MATQLEELYESDFHAWTENQAAALRNLLKERWNGSLDLANLAEEVESLGRSERRELRKRLTTIVEHLLKLEHSSRLDPREGWEESVTRSRTAIKLLLDDNPSLRREVPALVENAFTILAEFTVDQLIRRGEIDPSRREEILRRPYSEEQVLGPCHSQHPPQM